MAAGKSLSSLLFSVTVLLISGCSPDCKTCPPHAPKNTQDASRETWRTLKEGTFETDHVFYGQFGAAPYKLSSSFDPSAAGDIKPGSILHYSIFDANKSNIIFTAIMEKQPSAENTSTGGWVYSATNSAGEKIDVGEACFTCHQKQSHNDYLFSFPVSTKP